MAIMYNPKPLVFTLTSDDLINDLANRMDYGYYDPKYFSTLNLLKKTKFDVKSLEDTSIVSRISGFEVDDWIRYVDEGIIFLRVQNVKEFEIDLTDVKKIPLSSHNKLHNSKLKPGHVVITTTGRVGDASVIPETIKEANSSNQLARIIPFSNLDPNYLSVFLNLSIGQNLISRLMSGSTRPRILIKNLRKLKIIVPPLTHQQKITKTILNIVSQKKQLIAEKNKLYTKSIHHKKNAYEKVYKIIGVQSNDSKKHVFVIKPNELTERLDVQFFHSKNVFTLNSKYPTCTLSDLLEFSEEKISPKNSPYDKIKYIEISDVSSATNKIINYSEYLGNEAPSRASKVIHTNQIITCMSGSATGTSNHTTAIVPKQFNNFVVSSGFGILQPKSNVKLEFIFYMLQSDYILSEIHRRLTGATIPSIRKNEFLKIPMINVPENIQVKIIQLLDDEHKKYLELMKQSFLLEQKILDLENLANRKFKQFLSQK